MNSDYPVVRNVEKFIKTNKENFFIKKFSKLKINNKFISSFYPSISLKKRTSGPCLKIPIPIENYNKDFSIKQIDKKKFRLILSKLKCDLKENL